MYLILQVFHHSCFVLQQSSCEWMLRCSANDVSAYVWKHKGFQGESLGEQRVNQTWEQVLLFGGWRCGDELPHIIYFKTGSVLPQFFMWCPRVLIRSFVMAAVPQLLIFRQFDFFSAITMHLFKGFSVLIMLQSKRMSVPSKRIVLKLGKIKCVAVL